MDTGKVPSENRTFRIKDNGYSEKKLPEATRFLGSGADFISRVDQIKFMGSM